MPKKRTIIIEVSYSCKFTTERYAAYSCPEEALNAVLEELNREERNIVVHEVKAYDHPTELPTLPKHCGMNCLRFLTKKRQRQLKEAVRNQEHNMAQIEAYLIENDPDWVVV